MSEAASLPPIPLCRPQGGQAESDALREVVESGWWTAGPRGRAFEEAFAAHVGAREAVTVSSGTAALHLSLHALGIGPGDEVIVPASTYVATANVVWACGAAPVFADVDPRHGCITESTVRAVLGSRTRALLPVDALGMACDWKALARVARRHALLLVEDGACALGSSFEGRPVGGLGAWPCCFSFHPRKLLATGEGGMICTDDGPLAERLRRLRRHGESRSAAHRKEGGGSCRHVEAGFNYLMSDFQAALGLVQLEGLAERIRRRRAIARRYGELLASLRGLGLPRPPEGLDGWNVQSYQVMLPEGPELRDEVARALAAEGIATAPGVTMLPREPAWRDALGGPWPGAEAIADRGLILPCFAELAPEDLLRVCRSLKAALARS